MGYADNSSKHLLLANLALSIAREHLEQSFLRFGSPLKASYQGLVEGGERTAQDGLLICEAIAHTDQALVRSQCALTELRRSRQVVALDMGRAVQVVS